MGRSRSRAGAGQEQGRAEQVQGRSRVGAKKEQGRSMSSKAGVFHIPNFIITVLKPRS